MKIKSLQVVGFRNIANLAIEPGERINLFFGENGQGKTNLLEAIYSCVRGKSFRPYTQKKSWVPIHPEMPAKGSLVALSLENSQGYSIDCKMVLSGEQKWLFYFNDKRVSPVQLREQIPVVVFSPDDHSIIRGAPEQRRDYLDEVFTDICPGYAEVLDRFEKSLRSRNRILKSPNRGEQFEAELDTWTQVLAQNSAEISELRHELWKEFVLRFQKLGKSLFADFGLQLHVEFHSDLAWESQMAQLTKEKLAKRFYELIRNEIDKDLATGWTHRGPHRDDFLMRIDGVDARTSASQGQARLAALLLKWLHADWVMNERGEIPLFLIDDLSSELDAQRRKRLIELTHGINGQIFVTTTEPSLVDSGAFSEYTKFFVKQGVFLSENP